MTHMITEAQREALDALWEAQRSEDAKVLARRVAAKEAGSAEAADAYFARVTAAMRAFEAAMGWQFPAKGKE